MQKENKILLPVINKIYKEDYKNYRECAKKTLLLRKENHPLIVKYNKELTYFFDLPENDFLEKNNLSELLNNNELQTINSESVLDGIDGIKVGYHAKQYFIRNYNCFDFDDYERHLGAKMTTEKIQDLSIDILFEARFEYNDCVTKPDVLKRNGTGWELIEVKATTKVHREHFYDVLYQYYILTNCNIEIKNIYLMHLNSNYMHQFELDYDSFIYFNKWLWFNNYWCKTRKWDDWYTKRFKKARF